MARMFCSLKQAADRLNKTEEELKEIVKQGGLRGFPDGLNLFLKVDEVEALVLEEGIKAASKALEIEVPTLPARRTSGGPALETPALEAPQAKTAEPEVEEILEAHEPKIAEPESSILDMAEFESLDFEEKMVAGQASEHQAPAGVPPRYGNGLRRDERSGVAAEIPTAKVPRPAPPSAGQGKTKPRIYRMSSLRTLSMWQWLLKGLRQDNAVAVVVFGLLLCVIFLAFVVLAYVLYEI